MNLRSLVPAALLAAALATPALAASSSSGGSMSPDITWSEPYHAASGSAERCNVMARQFDFAVKWHEHAPKLKQAKLLRTQGVNLCASGEQTEGMAKLEQALGDLGIQPQS